MYYAAEAMLWVFLYSEIRGYWLKILVNSPQLIKLTPSNYHYDDVKPAKITPKLPFVNAKFKFYHELIPKAAMMNRIPMWKQLVWENVTQKEGLVVNFERVL